jgi:hypothetical protein
MCVRMMIRIFALDVTEVWKRLGNGMSVPMRKS